MSRQAAALVLALLCAAAALRLSARRRRGCRAEGRRRRACAARVLAGVRQQAREGRAHGHGGARRKGLVRGPRAAPRRLHAVVEGRGPAKREGWKVTEVIGYADRTSGVHYDELDASSVRGTRWCDFKPIEEGDDD